MKQIPLTQGKFALVDDEDYEWLMQWKWCFSSGYAMRTDKSGLKQRTVRMHRLILGDRLRPGLVCDHINRNGLDNRRENLRACYQRENCQNRTKDRGTSSSYRGVCLEKGKWSSNLTICKKKRLIGIFNSEIDAALAYNRAALAAGRMFVNLNPVVDDGRTLTPVGRVVGQSGLRGVYPQGTRWQARYYGGRGKRRNLGTYDTPEEAYAVYLQAKQKSTIGAFTKL